MSREHTDEVELFRQQAEELGFGHAEDFPEATADLETADEFLARMRGSVEGDGDVSGTVVHSAHRFRRSRWVLGVVGVAAAASLVLMVTRHGASPAAADPPPILDYEFATAATIAYAPGVPSKHAFDLLATLSAKDRPDLGSGDIQYKQTDNWFSEIDDDGTSRIVPRLSETWLRPDGSLTTHERRGQALSADGRGLAPDDAGKRTVNESLEPGSVELFEPRLSTDPAKLADQLLDYTACESRRLGAIRAGCLFSAIKDLYQFQVVRPQLTTALWRMLAEEKGFRSLGTFVDRAGRDAMSLSYINPAEPTYRELFFGDMETGQLIGFEEILIKTIPDLKVKPPSVTSFSTFLKTKFVNSAPKS